MAYTIGTDYILAMIAGFTVALMGAFGFWILRRTPASTRPADAEPEDEETQKIRQEKVRALLNEHLAPCTQTLQAAFLEQQEESASTSHEEKDDATRVQGHADEVETDEELGTEPIPEESPVSRRQKQVPNQCSICLGSYQPQDKVTWSSNRNCQHVFHHDCVFSWLEKSALQLLQKSRGPVDETLFVVPAMSCPCCRQVFIESGIHGERDETNDRVIQSGDGSGRSSQTDEEESIPSIDVEANDESSLDV